MANNSLTRWGFLAAALLLVFEVRATTIRIDIDTSALQFNGQPLNGQNWDLAFDLIKGNQDQLTNTGEISEFVGSLTNNPTFYPSSGNVSGSLSNPPERVTLNTNYDPLDPSATLFNEYSQNANIGSLISFVLTLTDNKLSGLAPDTFSFFFIDPETGQPLPTADPTGAGALFVYSIGNDDPLATFCPSTAECIRVSPVVVAIPEPSAVALAFAALLALGFTRGARRIGPRTA